MQVTSRVPLSITRAPAMPNTRPTVKAGGRLGQQAGVKLDQRKNWEVGEEVALKEGWRLERRPAPLGAFRPERKTPSLVSRLVWVDG